MSKITAKEMDACLEKLWTQYIIPPDSWMIEFNRRFWADEKEQLPIASTPVRDDLTAAMDVAAVEKSPLQLAEDRVCGFINGAGSCTESTHREATTLERLVMFKLLRIEFPHQSSTLTDLEIAIRRELKRTKA